MPPTEPITVPPPRLPKLVAGKYAPWLRAAQVLALLCAFLIGIRGLGTGFKGLGHDLLQSFFQATGNPFVGLVVGILATTLVQSSSVTTSMIVALVAAPEDALPIQNAVPMIMGANIGTTVTNTIVSLGHAARPAEFRKAFAAATCHDFFNFIAVAVFLPLELLTGYLTKLSGLMASVIAGTGGGGKMPNPIKTGSKAAINQVTRLLELLSDNPKVVAVMLIAVSAAIIFSALYFIVRTLRALTETRLKVFITRSLDKSGYIGMVVGLIVTVMVQSSSITTSVMVPLAAAGIVTLRQVFPICIGANIGTTVTALLASMAAPAETAHLAVQIALVHLLFNLSGTLLVYPTEAIRNLPLRAARWLAGVATQNRKAAVGYVIALFYGVPALLIAISKAF
jgi:sodium-dependent phosphate cotransporter